MGAREPREDTLQELRTEVAQLRRAMETRPTIDLARGMLMATFRLTPQTAWDVLVTTSQNSNTKLHRLADDLIEAVHGTPLPEELHEQLVAAVAKVNGKGCRPSRSDSAGRIPFPGRGAPGRPDVPR